MYELAQIVTAISTAVIAMAAFILARTESRQNREHNRLSVQPCLVLSSDFSNFPISISATLSNTGLGPAKIIDMKFIVAGKIVEEFTDSKIRDLISERIRPLVTTRTETTILSSSYVMPSSEANTIILLQFPTKVSLSREELEKMLEDFDIIVDYESFYGEKFRYDSRV